MIDNDILKYETKFFFAQYLIKNFRKKIKDILLRIDYKSIHEVGCGQGYNLKFLSSIKKADISGSDISDQALLLARRNNPEIKILSASVYNLPFTDNSFDLVVASEVLEHLEEPEKALMEIKRVTKKYCLFTVPQEPLWRVLNLCRGKYWATLGNPPAHLQHWSKRKFANLISQYFIIEKLETSLPWVIILGEKNGR